VLRAFVRYSVSPQRAREGSRALAGCDDRRDLPDRRREARAEIAGTAPRGSGRARDPRAAVAGDAYSRWGRALYLLIGSQPSPPVRGPSRKFSRSSRGAEPVPRSGPERTARGPSPRSREQPSSFELPPRARSRSEQPAAPAPGSRVTAEVATGTTAARNARPPRRPASFA